VPRYASGVVEISWQFCRFERCVFICSSAQVIENIGRFPSRMSALDLLHICNILSCRFAPNRSTSVSSRDFSAPAAAYSHPTRNTGAHRGPGARGQDSPHTFLPLSFSHSKNRPDSSISHKSLRTKAKVRTRRSFVNGRIPFASFLPQSTQRSQNIPGIPGFLAELLESTSLVSRNGVQESRMSGNLISKALEPKRPVLTAKFAKDAENQPKAFTAGRERQVRTEIVFPQKHGPRSLPRYLLL